MAAAAEAPALSSDRIAGHTDAVICLSLSADGALLSSGSEDGWVRVFDTSTQQLLHSTQLDPDSAVASITLGPAAGGLLFAAAGQTVHALDTRATLSPCFTLQGNSDEVGCVAVNQQGSYLAAADDAGDVFVFDLAKRAVFKAIGGAHSNIASGVCFRPHRPWELITGGLDSRVVKCDFSRGKVLQSWRMGEGEESAASGGQIFNPPFVHAVASPTAADDRLLLSMVAAARGDGAVSVFDADHESAAASGSGSSSSSSKGKGKSGGSSKGSRASGGQASLQGCSVMLDSSAGGHSRPVSAVQFTKSGGGRHVVSGGEDGRLVIWNWTVTAAQSQQQPLLHGSSAGVAEAGAGPEASGAEEVAPQAVLLRHAHRRKVNALACAAGEDGREHIYVADTSKLISKYRIQV